MVLRKKRTLLLLLTSMLTLVRVFVEELRKWLRVELLSNFVLNNQLEFLNRYPSPTRLNLLIPYKLKLLYDKFQLYD